MLPLLRRRSVEKPSELFSYTLPEPFPGREGTRRCPRSHLSTWSQACSSVALSPMDSNADQASDMADDDAFLDALHNMMVGQGR